MLVEPSMTLWVMYIAGIFGCKLAGFESAGKAVRRTAMHYLLDVGASENGAGLVSVGMVGGRCGHKADLAYLSSLQCC